MPPTGRSPQFRALPVTCSGSAERVWYVGDLAPEELDEIGPDATPEPPPSWTREEYRELLICRGVVDCAAPTALGIDGLLEIAEEFGLLERR